MGVKRRELEFLVVYNGQANVCAPLPVGNLAAWNLVPQRPELWCDFRARPDGALGLDRSTRVLSPPVAACEEPSSAKAIIHFDVACLETLPDPIPDCLRNFGPVAIVGRFPQPKGALEMNIPIQHERHLDDLAFSKLGRLGGSGLRI
jgi:hypothetical protein